jgi:peptidoglycan/LPS O-acetylase OafA/YrhL
MWQRKQTLFLLLAVIIGVMTLSSHFYSWAQFFILCLASSLNTLTIFLFKKRPLQAMLCTVSLFVYIIWYVALIVFSKQTEPDAINFQLPWSAVCPLVCMILVVMARKAIMADEKLVRDSDRLRR